MRSRFLALALAVLTAGAVGAAARPAAAAVEIDVNQGVVQPLPVAVSPFTGTAVGADIARVISADLERSGFFKPLDPASFLQRDLDVAVEPRFADWRTINAQALVNGKVSVDPDGRLRVDFRLWDVGSGSQLIGVQLNASPDSWRRIAHKISDQVYKRLTGEDGYFDTRVVFVAESGPRQNRVKRLAIMDQDGANPSYLTDGGYIVMTPRFSQRAQQITYMALRKDSARVYLFDIETGRQETLGSFSGMVFAPRFSPDGSKVALSVSNGGNTDIYVMDLRSRASRRLTTDPGIDTSPSFSPDGSQIVFTSDRSGTPQIYVMGADGSGPRRISSGSGSYTTPVWSPKGDLIAFTRQNGSEFHIGVMAPGGGGERMLTTSYLDEGPTWAPNGRVLMFSRESRSGGPRLWTVDVSGRNERASPYAQAGTDPAWSPLLK